MHALRIVQEFIRAGCPHLHAAPLRGILAAVAAAVRGRRLTLAELGRALVGAGRVKHSIKRIDRLLGNRHLATEHFSLYQASARRLVGALREPVIIVDWSDLTPDCRWQLLRAALPLGGRSRCMKRSIRLPVTRIAACTGRFWRN